MDDCRDAPGPGPGGDNDGGSDAAHSGRGARPQVVVGLVAAAAGELPDRLAFQTTGPVGDGDRLLRLYDAVPAADADLPGRADQGAAHGAGRAGRVQGNAERADVDLP